MDEWPPDLSLLVNMKSSHGILTLQVTEEAPELEQNEKMSSSVFLRTWNNLVKPHTAEEEEAGWAKEIGLQHCIPKYFLRWTAQMDCVSEEWLISSR